MMHTHTHTPPTHPTTHPTTPPTRTPPRTLTQCTHPPLSTPHLHSPSPLSNSLPSSSSHTKTHSSNLTKASHRPITLPFAYPSPSFPFSISIPLPLLRLLLLFWTDGKTPKGDDLEKYKNLRTMFHFDFPLSRLVDKQVHIDSCKHIHFLSLLTPPLPSCHPHFPLLSSISSSLLPQ